MPYGLIGTVAKSQTVEGAWLRAQAEALSQENMEVDLDEDNAVERTALRGRKLVDHFRVGQLVNAVVVGISSGNNGNKKGLGFARIELSRSRPGPAAQRRLSLRPSIINAALPAD